MSEKKCRFTVHRCQLYKPSTSAINGLAYEKNLKKLAVTRADGSLQIWDTRHNVVLEQVLIPVTNLCETVVWCRRRLYTTGSSGYLTQWQLTSSCPTAEIKISPSAVWCLAKSVDESLLYAGTEDGTILKFKVTEEGVVWDDALARTENRILSLACHDDGKTLISGSINEIKIWNLENRRCLYRISVGKTGNYNGPKAETLIWSLVIMKDYTIVSGDSKGRTSFWDAQNGTLLKAYRSHKSDVLCVTKDDAHGSVYSTGVDPSICKFVQVKENRRQKHDSGELPNVVVGRPRRQSFTDATVGPRGFVESVRLNLHKRDVRAVLATPDGWLFSGGLDAALVTYKYPQKVAVTIPLWTQDGIIVCRKGKLILFQYASHLELWKLASVASNNKHLSQDSGAKLDFENYPEKYADIRVGKQCRLQCSCMNEGGDMLAYSDQFKTTVLKMSIERGSDSGKTNLTLEKILPLDEGGSNLPATNCMCFSGHNLVLFCNKTKSLMVYDTSGLFVKFKAEMKFPDDCFVRKFVVPAQDVDLIAALMSTDDVWIVDLLNMKIRNRLPRGSIGTPLDAEFYCNAKFSCSNDEDVTEMRNGLTVLYSNGSVIEYDLQTDQFSDWTKSMIDHSDSDGQLANIFGDDSPPPTGLCLNPNDSTQIFVYSPQRLVLLRKLEEASGRKTLRVHFTATSTDSFRLLCKWIFLPDADQCVAVQVDEARLAKSLPAPFYIKKFGTG